MTERTESRSATADPPKTDRGRSRPTTGRHAALEVFVRGKIEPLQSAYLGARASAGASAALARLRRAATSAPGADPLVWGDTLEGLPETYHGPDGSASREEHAAHAAITLFAIHQQSRRTRMHVRGYSLGQAVARLATVGAERDGSGSLPKNPAVVRRFHALGTATSIEETLHHARGLVTQLRSNDIPLDYGLLAVHLARLQHPGSADGVRLDWGRDFHFHRPVDDADTTSSPADADPSDQN